MPDFFNRAGSLLSDDIPYGKGYRTTIRPTPYFIDNPAVFAKYRYIASQIQGLLYSHERTNTYTIIGNGRIKSDRFENTIPKKNQNGSASLKRKGETMDLNISAIVWENDYQRGLKLSREEKKPLFLDFFKKG